MTWNPGSSSLPWTSQTWQTAPEPAKLQVRIREGIIQACPGLIRGYVALCEIYCLKLGNLEGCRV